MSQANKKVKLSDFPIKKSVLAMSGFLSLTLASVGVSAQESDGGSSLEEVVVTGTLIRGTEVTGSQTIEIDAESIVEIGAVNTNEILASVPQVTNFFNSRPEENPRGSDAITISRPNLRNMPGFNSASGSVTLLLMDGHRIAPVGVREASVDADIFFGGVLQGVDIVTDGGSSLYGADAVAGVINFRTRNKFDGVQVNLDYGVGEDFNTASGNIIAGTTWDGGSIYAAVNRSERDGLKNGDRDWTTVGVYDEVTGEFTPSLGTECINPVRTNYVYNWFTYGGGAITGWTDDARSPGSGSQSAGDPGCDRDASNSLLPEQERNGFFLSYSQDVNENVNFGVKTYYSERTTTYSEYPLSSTAPAAVDVGVNPASLDQATIDQFGLPQPVPGENYIYPAGAGFSFGAHPAYKHRNQEINIATWGIAPELTIAMRNDWQLRNTFYYGRSNNTNLRPDVNDSLLGDYVRSGQLDPLNVAAADVSVMNDILDWENEDQTIHELFLARAVADGPVMDLPAGKLRMAAGFEVNHDRVRTRLNTGPIGSLSSVEPRTASRDNTAVFAELSIPVLETLDLSLSLRHDDYSDFGKTTNPQIGFNFTPTDWLTIFGHWGEAFNAPTALDSLALSTARTARANDVATDITSADVDVFNEYDGEGLVRVILDGTVRDIQPQTAETWALGFKMQPIEGLNINTNYYDIEFSDILGQVGIPSREVRLNNPDKTIWNYTPDEWAALLDSVENPSVFDGQIDPSNPDQDLAFVYDRRTSNFSEAHLTGVDFAISYAHDTRIGSMIYGLSGNYRLKFDLTQGPGAVTVDQLEDASRFDVSGILGWSLNNVRAKLTVKYSDGSYNSTQDIDIDPFIITDLFVGYNFQGNGGLTEGLSLRFNVDNLLDTEPQSIRPTVSPSQISSGFTLGRVFKVGISKSFF